MRSKIIPKVNETQEFIEIAFDFSNPLDLVREAISNAFDANATEIEIGFEVENDCGNKILKIKLNDNGHGMDMYGLHSFFDLGNSLSRENAEKIGEKGHGTKVYLNCSKLQVETQRGEKTLIAIMNEPSRELYARRLPEIDVDEKKADENDSWTRITIWGYNNNRRAKFTHENLKDYIMWFTKIGSIESEFKIDINKDVNLKLKGIDRDTYEEIPFGHKFPKESLKVSELFSQYVVDAPKYYCKKILKEGSLKNMPEIKYNAVFYIEGTKVKYDINPMIRRPGYTAPEGAYNIQDRYGLWICKDYMPIQRKNEWIIKKGYEYTRFHAFINCQDLKLTANRGSVENTPSEIMQDLQDVVEGIYKNIVESNDWTDIEWLESEADAYNTGEKETREFEKRLSLVNQTKIADYNNIRLVEPRQENGVYSIFMQLDQCEKNLFPFTILDYDTHSGIDVIVKSNNQIPVKNSRLYYVEFKYYLRRQFNHSFANLNSIVCWDINTNELKNGDEVEDVAKERRILQIIPPNSSKDNDYTRYFLDDVRGSQKIEIFVLKTYLKEKLNIEFKIRTEQDSY